MAAIPETVEDIISVNKKQNIKALFKRNQKKKEKNSRSHIQIIGKNLPTSFLTTRVQKQKEASLEFRPCRRASKKGLNTVRPGLWCVERTRVDWTRAVAV